MRCASVSDDVAVGAQAHTSANPPEQFRVVLRTSPTSPGRLAAACCPGWSCTSANDDIAVHNRSKCTATYLCEPAGAASCRAQDKPHLSWPLGRACCPDWSCTSVSDDVAIGAQPHVSTNPPQHKCFRLRTRQSSFVSCSGQLHTLPNLKLTQTPGNTTGKALRTQKASVSYPQRGQDMERKNGKYLQKKRDNYFPLAKQAG